MSQKNIELSETTIRRKLNKLIEMQIVSSEGGKPIMYIIRPTIDLLVLELEKQKRTNLMQLTNNLGVEYKDLIYYIRILTSHSILKGEVLPEDNKIFFFYFKD